ncbi:D-xylulose reductase A [Diaporthe amygdali]|uniref:D-xylulose reductase A n=1 Tax=Phomopsis amygdali TaxID=1214568 RepID=UPI0022FE77BE|nr:D-xylulose reductase A [Diaporthe amygdali]KAJ0109752.1 D-xylulose reductase A [Diaporthe amygdali]
MTLNTEDTRVPTENHACVMLGIEKLGLESRPMPPPPGEYEVIVAPKKTGICGSDMHLFVEGRAGESSFCDPLILGHEAAGVVVQVGSKVTSLHPGFCCRRCEFCKGGEYGQCGDFKFAAADGFDGTLQGFFTIPADFKVFELTERRKSMSLEEGALVEPLAVAVMAVSSVAKMKHNANVAVFGAGPVGLLTMAVAKALGARRILAVDVNQHRLKFAKDYCATDVHAAIPKNTGEDNINYSRRHALEIMNKFGFGERGEGIDLVVECSGAEVCVQTGIWLAKRRGMFVQVGAGPANNLIPMSILVNKEITVKESLRYGPGCYQLAIDLVRQGRINLKPLLTHRFPFKDAAKAFKAMQDGEGEDGKVTIKVIIDGPLAGTHP